MKKKALLATALIYSTLGAMAQDEMKVIALSHGHRDLGSARYQALSGAMGAIGADFSSVSQNPAGIALFRSSGKISLTGSGKIAGGAKDLWYGSRATLADDNKFSLTEFSYLTSWGTAARGVTFGLGVSHGGSFERELDASALKDSRTGTSLADYAAAQLNNADISHSVWGEKRDLYADANIPWIGTLGMKAGWLEPVSGQDGTYQTAFAYPNAQGELVNYAPNSTAFVSRERGGVTNMDFALGFRLSPEINLGLLIRGQSLSYDIYTSYKEGFKPSETAALDYLGLDNWLSISGMGVGFGFGFLGQIGQGLRLGASVYTPTFYHLKQDFSAIATGYNELFRQDTGRGSSTEYLAQTPKDAANAFRLNTPWRLGVNAAYIFGHKAIASLDYEFIYTASARLGNDGYSTGAGFSEDNRALRRHFRGMGRLRLGLEYSITPRVALRAGYRHETPISQTKLFRTPGYSELLGGTLVHYRLPKGTNALSLGTGLRLSRSWTLDIAYAYTTQKSEYTAIPSITDSAIPSPSESYMNGLEAIREEHSSHTMSATLSLRF
ncbi:MAG: hypothetical protein Q4A61_03625 [Porphyromonadaceae bacterium]|nr:hypothetical protein [Porphyromonadaceae bacterium]